MPAYDIDSESRGESLDPQPPDSWSMPVLRIAGVRIYLSYAVFVALAVLAGTVAMVHRQPGNADLPVVAFTAVAIWATGWITQVMVQFGLHFAMAAKSESITLGLVGVESAPPLHRRRPWTALANLTAAFCTLTALVILGAVCLVQHMLMHSADLTSWSTWADELATPGYGMDAVKNFYLTATWLLWIQAACQAYPMPRNLGRGAIASAITLFAAEADKAFQVKLLRRFLQVIAIATLVIAAATMVVDSGSIVPRWTILVLLSIYLWVSSNHHDLHDWVTSVHLAAEHPAVGRMGELKQPRAAEPETAEKATKTAAPWLHAVIDSVQMSQKRKRARAVWQREREEADDAARLDQVLQRVSELGAEGLSEQDRALLQRVSKNFRRDRDERP